MTRESLELLAPAKNKEIAIQALMHGADAIYIGGKTHGARAAAGNSLDDIAYVVEKAHQFRARVYATVNTIIYDNEIKEVETLCRELYHIGVDALIVQDMGILRMKIPPIELHASTQCDIRTPEKARFLQEMGFSQIVLARELSLKEIKEITESVTIKVETFVHGALCVCYSGKCFASFVTTGRSANRGECAQICRLPFQLSDSGGQPINCSPYLLSLKDFNLSNQIDSLIEAGVTSFKIEGRLKDADYVKNITQLYNDKLNAYISTHSENYKRSSFGKINTSLSPKADKSFNRGFTDYFLYRRQPLNIASMDTPKSKGEKIFNLHQLNNGDGISFVDKDGKYTGININKIENGKVYTRKGELPLKKDMEIYRTYDNEWQKKLSSDKTERRISVELEIDESGVTASDERGLRVRIPLNFQLEKAQKPTNYKEEFSKFGNTIYQITNYKSSLDEKYFIPRSSIGALRREIVEYLDKANQTTYPFHYRREENRDINYINKKLNYSENVANKLAKSFYESHGAEITEYALETLPEKSKRSDVVMTTRHCILRELGMCKKNQTTNKNLSRYKEPFILKSANNTFILNFDCRRCEMNLINPSCHDNPQK